MANSSDADRDRFAEWFMRSQRELYGYILAVVPKLDEADEIFQETGLVLWKKHEQLESHEHFLRFAFGVARNCIRSHLSKKGRDRHVFSEEIIEQLAAVRSGGAGLLDRQIAALGGCMEQLTDSQQRLIEAYYGGEQSTAEVAAEFELSENALYQRLHRIRKSLFDCVTRRLSREDS